MFLLILGASLTTFDRFQANARLSEQRNDASEEARRMADSLARDLRNLADPTTEALSIERNMPQDLVFRSVDPEATGTDANRVGVRRVRYCLDAPTGYVWRSTQTWTTLASPGVPDTGACGATDAWAGTCVAGSTCERKVVAQFVTNARPATPRPLFIYNNTTADAVTYIRVHVDVDVNAADRRAGRARHRQRRDAAQPEPPAGRRPRPARALGRQRLRPQRVGLLRSRGGAADVRVPQDDRRRRGAPSEPRRSRRR